MSCITLVAITDPTDAFVVSEGYFKFDDTDWNMDGQYGEPGPSYLTLAHGNPLSDLSKRKALQLLDPPAGVTPLTFSEFGTRRRRSFHAQDVIMRGLIDGYDEWRKQGGTGGALAGTSNVRDPHLGSGS